MPGGAKSDDVRLQAATLIVAGASRADVAQQLNVDTATIRRWISQDEEFQSLLQDLRAEVVSTMTGKLAARLDLAMKTLEDAMLNEKGHVKLRAAIAVFELYLRASEHGELRDRLANLEQLLDEHQQEESYR
jgi:transposase-like protein